MNRHNSRLLFPESIGIARTVSGVLEVLIVRISNERVVYAQMSWSLKNGVVLVLYET